MDAMGCAQQLMHSIEVKTVISNFLIFDNFPEIFMLGLA
jgi:hypothetical protein